MTAILNACPYPWGLPDAVRLHKDLTVAFPVVEDAKNLAAAAGLNPYRLNVNKDPEAFWRDVLNAAAEKADPFAKATVVVDSVGGSSCSPSCFDLHHADTIPPR